MPVNKKKHVALKFLQFSECEEYKNLIKRTRCIGMDMWNLCPIKITEYECKHFGHGGMIVGGTPAKPGEFPHMAGESLN